MIRKIIFANIGILFVLWLQIGILPHASLWGVVVNALALFVFAWNVVENPKSRVGLYIALIAGLATDMYSDELLGVWSSIFLLFSFLIKTIKERYVRVSVF